MTRALTVLVASWFLVPAAAAPAQSTSTVGPGVRAPVTFVFDTVLFRLPRADITDTNLVRISERRTGVRYYTKWGGAGAGRSVDVECLLTAGELAAIPEQFFPLGTDSLFVAPVRRYVRKCPLTTRKH